MLGLGVGDLGHEAGVGRHAVGHGLDAAVGEQDAVLPRHHAAVARLLLVEVVPDVVLDSVPVPGQTIELSNVVSNIHNIGRRHLIAPSHCANYYLSAKQTCRSKCCVSVGKLVSPRAC